MCHAENRPGLHPVLMRREARDVEVDLAAYYDQEADARSTRPLGQQRLTARDEFVSRLPPAGRMLEVGTGAGRDTEFLVERGLWMCGVDLSFMQLKHAAARGGAVAVGSVRQLPFPSECFAAAWTMSTLMHVPNAAIENALAEFRRVLAPNALAGIGVWGGPDVEEFAADESYDPPRLFSRRSDDRWQSLLTAVGRVEEFRTWGRGIDAFWYQWATVRRR